MSIQTIEVVDVTAQNAGTSSPVTFDLSSIAWQPGDLMEIWLVWRVAGATITVDGFTQRAKAENSGGGRGIGKFYRVMQVGDSDSVSVTCNQAAAGLGVQAICYRNVDTENGPYDIVSAVVNGAGTALPAAQTGVTTLTDGALAQSAVMTNSTHALALTGGSTQGFTAEMSGASYDSTAGNDFAFGLADKVIDTNGAVTYPSWSPNAGTPTPATISDAIKALILPPLGPIDGYDYHVGLDLDGTITEISCNIISVRIERGRDLPLDRFRTSTCTVEIDDPNGIYSAWGSEPGTLTAIHPGVDMIVWINDDAPENRRFTGIVDAIEDSFPDRFTHRVTFTAYDELSLPAAYDGPEQASQGGGELGGARMTRIADNAGLTGTRSFDTGVRTLQATTLAKNALDEMGDVVDAETGALFAQRDGVLRFVDANGLVGSTYYTEVQAILGDEDPEICYTGIKLATDLSRIQNVVTIGNVGGTPVTLTDAASIALYKARAYSNTSLIHSDPAESTDIAQRHLDLFSDAVNRVEEVTVDLVALTPAQVDEMLALDVLYLIEVRRRGVGVQIITTLQIEAISENVTASNWELTLKTYSAATIFTVARWDIDVWDTGEWGY